MSPSSRIRLGFSTICFYLPMFFDTVSMNSYVSFKWCHGLVCTLLFPSRAHSYICSFFRANMSPSSRIWLGFSPICFIGPVSRFCLSSYDYFIWDRGLVCYQLFPSRVHSYFCSFSERRCRLLVGLGWGFSLICFIDPCFMIVVVCVLISLSNGDMDCSVICYSPVVLTYMCVPF